MKVGERGQVTIPKDIRDQFGRGPETEVEFRLVGGNIVLQKAPQKTESRQMEGPLWRHLREAGLFLRGQVHGRRARPMITAVDTNLLFDILMPDEQFYDASARVCLKKLQAKAPL
jgi:AbrB family looped-hinge helix DNA binding protein